MAAPIAQLVDDRANLLDDVTGLCEEELPPHRAPAAGEAAAPLLLDLHPERPDRRVSPGITRGFRSVENLVEPGGMFPACLGHDKVTSDRLGAVSVMDEDSVLEKDL